MESNLKPFSCIIQLFAQSPTSTFVSHAKSVCCTLFLHHPSMLFFLALSCRDGLLVIPLHKDVVDLFLAADFSLLRIGNTTPHTCKRQPTAVSYAWSFTWTPKLAYKDDPSSMAFCREEKWILFLIRCSHGLVYQFFLSYLAPINSMASSPRLRPHKILVRFGIDRAIGRLVKQNLSFLERSEWSEA